VYAFVGRQHRIKWEYFDARTGVDDLFISIRDSSDQVVVGPAVMSEFASGGVYYVDWLPVSEGNFTGYLTSDEHPPSKLSTNHAFDIEVFEHQFTFTSIDAVQNSGRVSSSGDNAFVGTSNGNGVIVASPSSGAIAG